MAVTHDTLMCNG